MRSEHIGVRARGHLTEISDGMFAWYVSVVQYLASMKSPLLSVPSGGQGHRSRSNVKWVHYVKKIEDVPLQRFYETDVKYNHIGDK